MHRAHDTDTTAMTPAAGHLALEDAYRYCRAVAKHHAKTFYLASLFLPKAQQKPIFAIYALLRTVDDLVDNAEAELEAGSITRPEINRRLEEWKEKLRRCYEGEHGGDRIMMAWHDTLQSFNVPIELPLDLIDGVAMDIEFKPFHTFDELYVYCYKVASVVGLMTSEIFGYSDRQALQHAIDLGIAMQLTNILRDVGEDIDRNRIYIPLEDLERFGYSRREFMQRKMDERFVKLMQFQIERARSYYRSADRGIPMLEKHSRLAVALSSVNYGNILTAIEENGYDVFTKRAYRSFTQKIMTIPEIWLKTRTTK
ncbi:phytoene/squalene synthase family protein [Chlorobium sp. N1]|uniref:phytoene/squalene synthase family protein n=1 Tax=Chlorobium sp. N1 TaxID=2491138 RepID=UPI00103A9A17|nr:phytoene/squalene synthase family protein [Chlorobium sp. N1]TCD48533.1 phytoene/squalene synthase family protein [Chlorobium sp. N1]